MASCSNFTDSKQDWNAFSCYNYYNVINNYINNAARIEMDNMNYYNFYPAKTLAIRSSVGFGSKIYCSSMTEGIVSAYHS